MRALMRGLSLLFLTSKYFWLMNSSEMQESATSSIKSTYLMSAIIIIQVRRFVDAEGVRYYELNKSEEQYLKCKLLLDNILSSPGTRLTIIIILPHVFIILMPGCLPTYYHRHQRSLISYLLVLRARNSFN